jgi:hypothetical protein
VLDTRIASAPTRAVRVRAAALPVAVLLAITIILFWKLVFTSEYTWINAPDHVNQVVPWFQFQAKEWHAHRFPLWDPYHWCGQPLIGQTQPGAVYPLNWILFLLPLDHGRISIKYLNWYMVVIHFMAALFAYLLCRETGCSKRASVLGASAFAFGGYLASTEWPQMINGAIWTPLPVLFFLRATRGCRPLFNSAVSGAFLGIAFLSGHHQAPMFLLLFMSGLWLHAFFTAEGIQKRRLFAMASLFIAFVFLLGAAQIVPAVEYGKMALRWVNAKDPVGWKDKVPYQVHRLFSMNPASALSIVIPGPYSQFNPFLGPTILVLAIGGAIAGWANRLVRMLTFAALAALLFSLGSFSPFEGFLYATVPDLDKARAPAAAVFLFQLAASVLAAFGCDQLIRAGLGRAGPDGAWRKLAWGAWIFGALVFVGLFAVELAQGERLFYHGRPAVVALTAIGAGAVILSCGRDAIAPACRAAILVVLAMVDLSTNVGYAWASKEEGWKYVDTMGVAEGIAQFLRSQPGDFRVWVNSGDLGVNLGDWDGIEQYNGYTGVPTSLYRVSEYPHLRLLFGERFYVGREPLVANGEVFSEVFRDPSGLNVYYRGESQPRVWTVHQVLAVKNFQQLFAELAHPLDELRSKAVLIGAAPTLDSCGGGDHVRSLAHGQSVVAVKVQMACRGMLILADTFTPGWTATVDGHPAAIYQTYGAVRGVVVPAGDHRVDFRYRPMSVFLGLGLTALGTMLLAAMWIFARLGGRRLET